MNMNKAQIILNKWIRENFKEVAVEFETASTAKIIDKYNDTMTITLNLYGDILEVGTNKLLAISDLPHDIESVGNMIPQSWRGVPYTS